MPSVNTAPITPPRVPVIDPRTGLIAREWYLFFLTLFRASQTIDYVDLTPQNQDVSGDLNKVYSDVQLTAAPQTDGAQISELAKRVEALECLPVDEPRNTPRYGSFYDTTTQTAAAINTAYAITFNTTDLSQGVYIGSPTSRVYVDRPGVYNIQFSTQLDNTSGGSHLIFIWLRVNGTDVPQTASQVRLKGTDGELVAAWNFAYKFNAGDYFELMWSVSDTAIQIVAQAAAAPVPAIPSIILTVTDNISA
jgi:hypothetical protein